MSENYLSKCQCIRQYIFTVFFRIYFNVIYLISKVFFIHVTQPGSIVFPKTLKI